MYLHRYQDIQRLARVSGNPVLRYLFSRHQSVKRTTVYNALAGRPHLHRKIYDGEEWLAVYHRPERFGDCNCDLHVVILDKRFKRSCHFFSTRLFNEVVRTEEEMIYDLFKQIIVAWPVKTCLAFGYRLSLRQTENLPCDTDEPDESHFCHVKDTSIQLPASAFPLVGTAARCSIDLTGCFLDRQVGNRSGGVNILQSKFVVHGETEQNDFSPVNIALLLLIDHEASDVLPSANVISQSLGESKFRDSPMSDRRFQIIVNELMTFAPCTSCPGRGTNLYDSGFAINHIEAMASIRSLKLNSLILLVTSNSPSTKFSITFKLKTCYVDNVDTSLWV